MSDTNVTPIQKPDERLVAERAAAVGIVEGIREGDSAAENALFERYAQGLRYLLVRWSGDAELAQDLLQETFLVALQKLRSKKLDEPERLAGFLKGIARNVARSGLRRRNRDAPQLGDDLVHAIPDPEPKPFQNISAAQIAGAVQELLESMTVERDRELLRRYYIYDQNKPEICRELGLDSLHFNRVLYRAKRRFRQIVENADSTGDLLRD